MDDKKKLVGSPWNINTGGPDWHSYNRVPSHSSNVSGIRLARDTLGATTPVNTIGGNWTETGPRGAMGSEDEGNRGDLLADLGFRLVFDTGWSRG